jgi:hypothetical protein
VRDNYQFEYPDLSDVFKKVVNHEYVKKTFTRDTPFQILLNNGDNDLVCDHIEAEYFVENLKTKAGIRVRYDIFRLNVISTLRKKPIECRGELIYQKDLRETKLP